MILKHYPFLTRLFLLGMMLSNTLSCLAQCTVDAGTAPSASYFNTAEGESPGGTDKKWTIANDYNGLYKPAVVMSGLPPVFYNSRAWISFSESGEHTGDKYFFYKINFDLPCRNECGREFRLDSTFCLSLDLYSDNSIFEIYVNDKPQSSKLGGLIPLPDPFNPPGRTPGDKTPVTLCSDWKGGNNTLIIQVASSATIAGLMIAESPGNNTPGIIVARICEGESYLGYTAPGVYEQHYKAPNGCDSTRIVKVILEEEPAPDLGVDKALCEGDSLLLSPGQFASYSWQDGSNEESKIVRTPGIYSVITSNRCGTGRDEIIITKGNCSMYFPNAFTPNGDGKNDVFRLLSDFSFSAFHLTVYNRWGQKVFESTSAAKGWDGFFKGQKQPDGVYAWYCTLIRDDIPVRMNGTVTILR